MDTHPSSGRATDTHQPAVSAETTDKLGYLPALDGIRGIGIFIVVLAHSIFWPPGALIALDVFFALSGFLITTLLLEEWRASGSLSLRRFYGRRALRILPAALALLLAYTMLAFFLSREPWHESLRLRGVIFSFSYVTNWAIAFDWGFPAHELGHLWSLAVEEQFYILWPPALLVMLRSCKNERQMLRIVVFVLVGIFFWRLILLSGETTFRRLYFGTDTRLDAVLIGCAFAVAWASPLRQRMSLGPPKWAVGASVVYLALVPLVLRYDGPLPTIFTGVSPLAAAATCVIILGCLTNPGAGVNRFLSRRPLVRLGILSYSLYLWHFPIIGLIAHRSGPPLRSWPFVVSVPLSVAAAVISNRLIEVPFLALRERWKRGATISGSRWMRRAGSGESVQEKLSEGLITDPLPK